MSLFVDFRGQNFLACMTAGLELSGSTTNCSKHKGAGHP